MKSVPVLQTGIEPIQRQKQWLDPTKTGTFNTYYHHTHSGSIFVYNYKGDVSPWMEATAIFLKWIQCTNIQGYPLLKQRQTSDWFPIQKRNDNY